jgi:hypothetical protein
MLNVKCLLLVLDFNKSWNICRQSFVQLSNIQFHVNPSSYFRVLCIHPDWSTGKYDKGNTDFFLHLCYQHAVNWIRLYFTIRLELAFVILVWLLFVQTCRSVIQEFSALHLSFIKWLVSWNLFHFLFSFSATLLGQFPKRISWQRSIISSSTHYER